MTFSVKYRTKNGSIAEEVIEAENRSDCFAKCKERGITVMELRAGGANSGKHCPTRPARPTRLTGRSAIAKLLIAIVAIAAAAGGIWLWIGDEPGKTEKPVKQNHSGDEPRRVRSDDSTDKKQKPRSVGEKTKKHIPVKKTEEKRMYLGSEVLRSEFFTNGNIVVERVFTADGKRHRINHVPPSIFKNASDEYLAIFLSTPPGAQMAPFPDLSRDGGLEKAFLESLNEEIVINENDSDSVKDIKAKVIAAREAMDAMMRQGMTFVNALESERQLHNENQTIKAQVKAEYAALIKNSDPSEAEEYRLKINKVLKDLGIEEIERKDQKHNLQQGDNK